MKMKTVRRKKVLAVSGVSLVALIVGATIAVSHDSSLLRSLFNLGLYKTSYVEEFISPTDWKTCDVTPKTVIVKNESTMDIAVRLSYEEFWKAADGTTDLPLQKDGTTLALIKLQNTNDWELNDGYYYYKADVEPGHSTNSLFQAVEYNCQASMSAGTDQCVETATGQDCTQAEDDYAGAHYHLRVTVETIQADKRSEWAPDESKMIYGVIKSSAQTNGIDSNINFSEKASSATGNGNGVNILNGTQNSAHPIYYYRGEVDDNNVIWGDYCWKILRSTDTGGTKIFYNGPATNGQCTNNNPDTVWPEEDDFRVPIGDDIAKYYISYSNWRLGNDDADDDEIGFVGYMYDLLLTNDIWHDSEEIPDSSTIGKTYIVSNKMEYSDGKYRLIDPVSITVAFDGEGDDLRDHVNFQTITREGKYYYACRGLKTTECTEAIFMDEEPFYSYYGYNGSSVIGVNRYILRDGLLQPELYRRMLQSNEHDSNAKAVIDDWYEKNIKGKPIEADIEDTVFCNDRTISNIPLKDMTYEWATDDEWYSIFLAYDRLGKNDQKTYAPTLDCNQPKDRFTRYSANGNGDLKYSIGMMTGDEMVLSGQNSDDKKYRFGIDNWGMSLTPTGQEGGSGGVCHTMYGDQGCASSGGRIRPVVSLKYGTEFIEGGDGTLQNPYVVK